MKHSRLVALRWTLFFFCIVFGILTGAGLFQTITDVPGWNSGEEVSRTYEDQYGPGFFPMVSPLLGLTLLCLMVLAWRAPRPLRAWVYAFAVPTLVLLIATGLYFVPMLVRFESGALTGEAFDEAIGLWAKLDLVRQLTGVILLALSIYAYGLSQQPWPPTEGSVESLRPSVGAA